jgi:hypothetical protein
VRGDDEGIYICRAHNDLGEAVTTASMKIKSETWQTRAILQNVEQINTKY